MTKNWENAVQCVLRAGSAAPSGDNLQPWNFSLGELPHSLKIFLDQSADTSPMNAGQRMSRIALGAFLQNVRETAVFNGWKITETVEKDTLTLRFDPKSISHFEIPNEVFQRCTNRKKFTNKDGEVSHTLPKGVAAKFRPPRSISNLIAKADTLMFGEANMMQAFASSLSTQKNPKHGLSASSLEIPQLALRFLRLYANNSFLRAVLPLPFFIGRHSKMLVNSSKTVICILQEKEGEISDIEFGCNVQKVWLDLTRKGFSIQPMMSIPVLENRLKYDSIFSNSDTGKLASEIVEEARKHFELKPGQRFGFMMRVGFSSAPSGRTSRKEIPNLDEINLYRKKAA